MPSSPALRLPTTARRSRARTRARPTAAGVQFDGYLAPKRPNADAYDEMFDADGTVRAPYRALYQSVSALTPDDLTSRAEAIDRAMVDQGITFSLSGQERPFPLDLVPRVIQASEWTKLERGVAQRVRALEAFLADVYGDAHVFRDGVIPRQLITSCEHFHREAAGINPPNGVRIHVAGIDLVRDEQGTFRVLEDNLRSPSGVSYVMENRRTMARVFPDLFAKHRVRPVGDYATHLLRALRAAAAPNVADPMVVVLTPGVANSAYFEHSLLARQMGVELVEGRDLFCRDNVVYLHTTQGERQVDVVYRRIDDEFLDPLHFRPNSVLGVAGVLNAARAGNVVIANAVGNGVGDDKLVYTYVPELVRYYLGEKPLLPNVDTFRCWLPDEFDYVLSHAEELVIKPVEGSGGYGIVFGPSATAQELAVLGIPPPADGTLDVWSLTEVVAYDQANASSIVGSITSARENTRGAREVVSTELWQCLNATWTAIPERQRYARRAGPHSFLSFVEERAAMFAGLADTTICRDEGWLFLVLGRYVERADMVLRLLLSRVNDKATSPGWLTVLASVGAQDTYLRTYRGALDAGRIVKFLLRDPLFPRSVFHALRQAESCLDQLERGEHGRANVKSEALRLVGRARSELEFLRSSDLLDDLPKRLLALQTTMKDVGDAVSMQYFSSSPWVAWADAEVSL